MVHADASVLDEGGFGVVELGLAVAICVVGDLVVVPDGDPGELLVAQEEIEVGAVRSEALAVVVEGVDLAVWEGDAVECIAISIFSVLLHPAQHWFTTTMKASPLTPYSYI